MRRRSGLIVGMLATLALVPALALAQGTPVNPEKVKALLAQAGAPGRFPGADAVIVFDHRDVEVEDSGLSRMLQHTLTRALTLAGARELSVGMFPYDPLSADVTLVRARVHLADGLIRDIDPATVQDAPDPASLIYWNARHRLVPIGRLEVGDAVEIVTRRVGFTYALLASDDDEGRFVPPMRGHFYDIVPFYSPYPAIEQRYRVKIDPAKQLQYQVFNGAAEVADRIEDGRRVVTVTVRDFKPLTREPGMVSPSDVAPKLLLTTAADWKAKAIWFHQTQETAGCFTVTPEVKAIADSVTRGLTRDEDKAAALNHWVAENIRYVGLHMGAGEGFTLHPAAMTLRDRGGVCKDKAGMLVALLRAAGLESYPAMTMAGERIERIAADQFNHCITVWRKPDGSTVLLDPTWIPGAREMWSSREQQQEVLMGLPEGADLLTTALSPASDHPLKVAITSRLAGDGTLTGTLVAEADGQSDAGLRRLYRGRARTDWAAIDASFLTLTEPRAVVTGVVRTDPDDLSKPFTISLRFSIPSYGRVLDDGSLVIVPLAARHPVGVASRADEMQVSIVPKERTFPMRIGCTRLVTLSEHLALPPGATVTGLPEAKQLDGNGRLSSRWTVAGGELVIDERLEMTTRIIEPAAWPSLRAAFDSFRTLGETMVLITPAATARPRKVTR